MADAPFDVSLLRREGVIAFRIHGQLIGRMVIAAADEIDRLRKRVEELEGLLVYGDDT